MTKLITFFTGLILLTTSCKKDKAPAVLNEDTPAALTTIVAGTFVSSAHTSSGTVKIAKDAANKTFLVFENFKTDNGPDLRVWLSANNNGTPAQEVGLLKAASGNFTYPLDASFLYNTNNRVLIWCKQFSVLFGYAVLQ